MREKTGGLRTGKWRFYYDLKTHNTLLQGKICNIHLHYYFFFWYVTSMSKCLEFEAHLQCSTGKSDLTCLFYPHLGTPNTFLLTQNPAMVSYHTAEHSACSVTLWSTLTLCCSGYHWFMLLRVCYHFAFASCKTLELL